MQFEKIGRGLLREAFWGEGECLVSRKRGEIRKDWSWKTQVNIVYMQSYMGFLMLAKHFIDLQTCGCGLGARTLDSRTLDSWTLVSWTFAKHIMRALDFTNKLSRYNVFDIPMFGFQAPTVIESTLMYYRMEMDRRVCMAYLISVCIRLFLERRDRELSQFVTLFKAASAADEKISLMERFLAELW